MKFWTTAPEAYDYSYTVDTNVRSGLKLGHIYRLVEIRLFDDEVDELEYQIDRYRSGLYPCILYTGMEQELP